MCRVIRGIIGFAHKRLCYDSGNQYKQNEHTSIGGVENTTIINILGTHFMKLIEL